MNKPKVSVVIVNYKNEIDIFECLDSIYKTKSRSLLEIIIVDNNSNDNTMQVVESYAPKFNGKLKYLFESKQGKRLYMAWRVGNLLSPYFSKKAWNR